MAAQKLKPVSRPIKGKEYDILTCSWCDGPAPLFEDRRGEPFIRCAVCGCRSFGSQAAMMIAKSKGLLSERVTWPVVQSNG